MTIYYKATRPDGTDFHTGTVLYEVGQTVTHPSPHRHHASGYLSVSTTPTDCTGSYLPLRLLEVEADKVWIDSAFPNKRCTHSVRVVRELDPTLALGPQGPEVLAFIERCKTLDHEELHYLTVTSNVYLGSVEYTAEVAGRAAAWEAISDAAGTAARVAAWTTHRPTSTYAWDASRAVRRPVAALLVRDLIGTNFTKADYDRITGPWRSIIGPLHPDDPDLRIEEL